LGPPGAGGGGVAVFGRGSGGAGRRGVRTWKEGVEAGARALSHLLPPCSSPPFAGAHVGRCCREAIPLPPAEQQGGGGGAGGGSPLRFSATRREFETGPPPSMTCRRATNRGDERKRGTQLDGLLRTRFFFSRKRHSRCRSALKNEGGDVSCGLCSDLAPATRHRPPHVAEVAAKVFDAAPDRRRRSKQRRRRRRRRAARCRGRRRMGRLWRGQARTGSRRPCHPGG